MFSHRTDWKRTPNRFTKAQQEILAKGREVLDLTESNPTRVGLPYDGEAILPALSRPESLVYNPQPKGLLGARKAVAQYYREQHEVFDLNLENILLTTGTSEAYAHLFHLLCNVDDEILVARPSYPLLQFIADLQDTKLVPYPLLYDHGWQIDFPSLYKAVNHRTRAITVVHPNNPTGSFVRPEDVVALNNFCRECDLALVVDEVFLDYAHDGAGRTTFVSNQNVLTFTLSGLSKISALPQMKAGWIVTTGPTERVEEATARLEIIGDTYLSMNAPVQLATSVLLDQRKVIQPLLLDRLRANLEELDRQLSKQKACCRLDVEGGWYATLRVPVTQADEELAISLLRKVDVQVHPGHFYDFPEDGYLVLSLITPTSDFREGIHRVLEIVSGS